MLAISLSVARSTGWWEVFFFFAYSLLETLRIVTIFFKDLQDSLFEKHLSPNWGWVGGGCSSQLKKAHNKAVWFFFFFKLFENLE